jgi:hypothetical protein
MESGSSRFSRSGRAFWFGLIAALVLVSGGAAQQPVSGVQPGQSRTSTENPPEIPTGLPTVQPLSQAAVSASGTAAKTQDTAKDAPDQSALVKLGRGI